MIQEKLKFLSDQFNGVICAVDEVGYGACFGPIVSCALVMPVNSKHLFVNIRDSKKVCNNKRYIFYNKLVAHCKFSLGFASNYEIDIMNVRNANILCCLRAISNLDYNFDMCFIDGNMHFNKQQYVSIPKGDETYIEIAAASIIAKVSRDYFMHFYGIKYANYDLDQNKGYCTKNHMNLIRKNGITDLHRRSFLKNL